VWLEGPHTGTITRISGSAILTPRKATRTPNQMYGTELMEFMGLIIDLSIRPFINEWGSRTVIFPWLTLHFTLHSPFPLFASAFPLIAAFLTFLKRSKLQWAVVQEVLEVVYPRRPCSGLSYCRLSQVCVFALD